MTAPATHGIPSVEEYPLPAEGDLPDPTPPWAVDPRRAVLLIHDMQKYFVDRYPANRSPRAPLVTHCAQLREAIVDRGGLVAYTAQPGGMTSRQRGLLGAFWGSGMSVEPADRAVVAELAPRPHDWVLDKWRYSAFHGSDLAARLADAGRDQLVICGVYAHVGVLSTALDAFSRDLEVFLVADAVADFTRGHHDMAVTHAARTCAVIQSTSALLAGLDTAWPASPTATPTARVTASHGQGATA